MDCPCSLRVFAPHLLFKLEPQDQNLISRSFFFSTIYVKPVQNVSQLEQNSILVLFKSSNRNAPSKSKLLSSFFSNTLTVIVLLELSSSKMMVWLGLLTYSFVLIFCKVDLILIVRL